MPSSPACRSTGVVGKPERAPAGGQQRVVDQREDGGLLAGVEALLPDTAWAHAARVPHLGVRVPLARDSRVPAAGLVVGTSRLPSRLAWSSIDWLADRAVFAGVELEVVGPGLGLGSILGEELIGVVAVVGFAEVVNQAHDAGVDGLCLVVGRPVQRPQACGGDGIPDADFGDGAVAVQLRGRLLVLERLDLERVSLWLGAEQGIGRLDGVDVVV